MSHLTEVTMPKTRRLGSWIYVAACLAATPLLAQTDPGPRSGAPGAGGPIVALSATEKAFFNNALSVFVEVDSVKGVLPGESGKGLGPTYNANSCAACHAQPAIGGTSPVTNPQVAQAKLDGATNTVPSFITLTGPVREARFISTDTTNPKAPLDGGVHALYTIKGRSDAPGCNLAQPNFATQLAAGNVSFRIPTPVFGLGLVELTSDAALQTNLAANAATKAPLGITGHLNTNGNDGTITRFGWKAQNKSLLLFAGEAYNVEQGVSNEIFPNERSQTAACTFNPTPEDFTATTGASGDIVQFGVFMRLSAPPTATTASASEVRGKALFTSTGCVLCHSETLTTGTSQFTGMGGVAYHPYSDFALHNMGSVLADGVVQGDAGPAEFRTAPLWGLGQRLFLLHDGRTPDLVVAIQQHDSPATDCVVSEPSLDFLVRPTGKEFNPSSVTRTCGSEASGVVAKYTALTVGQKQDLLNFLRSL